MSAVRAVVIAIVGLAAGCDLVFGLESRAAQSTPSFVNAASAFDENAASLIYAFDVPDGADRALIVSVQLGSSCVPATPEITSVAYAGRTLAPIASIVGTPCGTDATRSEQWLLVAPPVGTADVVVTLSMTAQSVHSAALTFTGVDQADPVRDVGTASGAATLSTVAVTSATGDLVVNTVGQGNSIVGPGAEATLRFLTNVDDSNTLNNTAGSTIPGGEPAISTTWSFGANDEWQTISTSLVPAR